MTRLLIVGCGAAKLDHAAPARDLYIGGLFRAARAYAEATGHPWRILSALHGIVSPNREIEPYNLSLPDRRRGSVYGLAMWHEGIMQALLATGADVVEVHAGMLYGSAVLEATRSTPIRVIEPLAGLQIGQRLAWYKARR